MERMILNPAAQIGVNEILHLLGIIFLGVIAFVWLAMRRLPRKVGGAAAGRH